MFAYLTHDEVNAAVAKRFARRLRLELTVLQANTANQAVEADWLIIDLDHLPSEYRTELMARAAAGKLPDGLTAHSYNLMAAERRVLRAAGVHVARRLTLKVVARCEAAKMSV